jgi:hypothetical protein
MGLLSGALEELGDRKHRADAHFARITGSDGEAAERAERREAAPGDLTVAHDDAGGCAVGELARVAGGDRSSLDRRRDPRDAFERGVRADPLVFRRGDSLIDSSPVSLSTTFIRVVIGTISSVNRPSRLACAARCWLWTPKTSCASRPIPYFAATYSAVSSIGQ